MKLDSNFIEIKIAINYNHTLILNSDVYYLDRKCILEILIYFFFVYKKRVLINPTKKNKKGRETESLSEDNDSKESLSGPVL